MKNATQRAGKVRQLLKSLRAGHGRVTRLPVSDPITQLLLGVLTRNVPEAKARETLDRLRTLVVDYNELRVIPPMEMAQYVGEYPDVRLKCEDISRALNRIFAIEHSVTLDRLPGMSRKDANAYLLRIEGLEAYTRARIRLLGFQQHAVPLDEAMWAFLCKTGLIDEKATLDDAQGFLERTIDEEDVPDFVALLKRHAWSEIGSAVRRGETPRILSVPPDRTTRNMLQQITGGGSLARADDTRAEPAAAPAAAPRVRPPAAKRATKPKPAQKPAQPKAATGRTARRARSAGRGRAKSA